MENEPVVTPTPAIADWRAILAREVDLHPRGKAGVAARLGVSRAYVSRAMSEGTGAYAKVPQRFIARVIDRFHVVDFCPATWQPQPRHECNKANRPAPTHNPLAMRIWRCCQTCPHKPNPNQEPRQ